MGYPLIPGDQSGVLTMQLPSASTMFGFGFSLGGPDGIVLNVTTISLFNGNVGVGSLSFNAAPDANFPGGFAGIQSTTPFNTVQVTFQYAGLSYFNWAIDNIRVAAAPAVPEPGTFALLGVAGMLLCVKRRLKQLR